MKKKPHGGARNGAGRPKTKEDTVVIRIPKSKVDAVKRLLDGVGIVRKEDFLLPGETTIPGYNWSDRLMKWVPSDKATKKQK